MYRYYLIGAMLLLAFGCTPKQEREDKSGLKRIYLNELDLDEVPTGWKNPAYNLNLSGKPIGLGGQTIDSGVCLHAYSEFTLRLDQAKAFHALVGIDDKLAELRGGSVNFYVLSGLDTLYKSKTKKSGDQPDTIDIALEGISAIKLVSDDGMDGSHHDWAVWGDAWISYLGEKPSLHMYSAEANENLTVLTPDIPKEPTYNFPRIYSQSVGKPFLFKLPISGEPPMQIRAEGLPRGLSIDSKTGIITGKALEKGRYQIAFTAKNTFGEEKGYLTLVIGDTLAFTPPMGWNSWNAYGLKVSEQAVRETIKAFERYRLADFGYQYLVIDDGWMVKQRSQGHALQASDKFENMKGLADRAHEAGLKLGIYSSPGTTTCGNFPGSYAHEQIDAKQFADWGIDYLKYDFCSYSGMVEDPLDSAQIKPPYLKMGKILAQQDRDIVYSLCEYGHGEVWKWGQSVEGQLWRTTNDLIDTWHSLYKIGFMKQKGLHAYAGPGHWNDPDMLVIGQVSWNENEAKKTRLSPNEQYTHISLWAMLSAPLMLGCDLSSIDDFTLGLIRNREIIEINQDALGQQARLIYEQKGFQVWQKPLTSQRTALAVFNIGDDGRAFDWAVLDDKLQGKKWRDPWRQQYIDELPISIDRHGVCILVVE